MKKKGLQTTAIHGGEIPDQQTGASTPNIVMSSTYVVEEPISFSVTNMDAQTPYIYTRWSNPTTRQLETKLCMLENAEQCIALASGLAASSGILFSQLHPGDHLVISNTNYPGTAEISRDLLPSNNIDVTAVDSSSLDQIRAAMRPNTTMVWLETPSNPLLRISDIAGAAEIAHAGNAILVVDSTFATPVASRPLELGADLVVHSLTKYIGGHGDALGGAILGNREMITRLRESGVMHYGAAISPFNAWLIMRGAATLPLRMKAHQENAMAVATFLESHPSVELVRYPGLPSHPQHDLAASQMNNFSGMVAFRTKAPVETANAMMKQLEVIHYAVSLGHHRSLVYLMETRDLIESSFMLKDEELSRYQEIAGEGIFRLSVGLEDSQDLVDDLAGVL